MGKKSKRGVVKTAKPHAAAGKGRSGRSGSVSEDGRSVASQDSAPTGPKPVVSKPPGNVAYSLPPQLSTNGGDQNNKASIPIKTAPAPVVPAPAPAVKAPAPVAKPPKAAAAVPAPDAAATEKNGMWSGNLRDAVKADAEGPAVLDVTMNEDEDGPAEPKVAAPAASATEPVVQSRSFSLTEPAPKEAKSDKNECACVIL